MTDAGRGVTARPDFLRSVIRVLARRLPWGAGIAAAVMVVVALVLLLSRPVYRAEARLRIGEPPPSPGVSATGGLLSFLRTGGDPFANDLEILSSRTLAEEVVRTVALSVRLDAPRGWTRDSLFTAVGLSSRDTTFKATWEATWEGDQVRVERTAPQRGEVGRFRVGEAAEFGGMELTFAPRREGGPTTIHLVTRPFGEAVRSASGGISLVRTRRDANVLQISYTHDDPGVADAVVNAAVSEFIRLRARLFRQESDQTVDSLKTVARGTRAELRAAEDSLERVQRRTGLVAPDAQSEALVQRYEIVYQELTQARAELDLLDRQLIRVDEAADPMSAWSTLVAHPRFLENQTVGTLLERLTLLEEQRTATLAVRQPESREARTLDQQIRQLDEALRKLVSEYRTSLADGVAELEHRRAELERVVGALPAQAVAFGRGQREVRVLSEVSVLTEQRLRQEELRLALAFSNVQVVDPPALRYRPVWPRKKLGLAAGLLIASGAGLLGMVVVERADPTVRSARWLEDATGSPVVALRAGAPPSEAELATLRSWLGETGVIVPIGPMHPLGAQVLDAVREPARARAVASFADATVLAGEARRCVLACVSGRSRRQDVERVSAWLSRAGCPVSGSVVVVRRRSEVAALWD